MGRHLSGSIRFAVHNLRRGERLSPFVLSCSIMLVAAVTPTTKVGPDLFPLSHRREGVVHSSRDKKSGACPSTLRFAFGVSGPWPAAK